MPQVITTRQDMYQTVATARREGHRIGVVPTMGALHEGHLSLVRASLAECDRTIVTIFVNPAQFGPQEDFQRYPRTLQADLQQLAPLGVRWVFAPAPSDIYPEGFSTYVEPPAVSRRWEGECRPGHFQGVATVVLKLFHIIPADVAFFGQKDYQQALVLRRMVDDLNVSIEVRVCPIVREPDGLAMSSRNVYLSPTERRQALALSRSLQQARQLVASGQRSAGRIEQAMRQLLVESGIDRIDYVALVDPETLEPVRSIDRLTMALLAVHVGSTRLLDNCRLEPARESAATGAIHGERRT